LQLCDEYLIGLLQKGYFDFVQQVWSGDAQAVLGDFRAWKIDVTFPELILGHAPAPSAILPAP
jgi:hypothetical protein